MSGAAAAAFALGSMSVAAAGPCTMSGMMSPSMPHCTPATGPVVWYMASAKTYYLKGSMHYGKGKGMYVCRATAVARGGHPGMAGTMGGMHGTMGGSHGTMGGHGSPMTMTMAPRPMSSSPSSAMPGSSPATPGPGLPNSTNAAPGSQGSSPRPMTSGNPMSGNQGNTGAPGAGGQVPNNPASSSNSNPNPSPSPHP
jgi:hypothetical protein